MAIEEERKYDVDPRFRLPDLAGCVPPGGVVRKRGPKDLVATYYDTTDLRLARSGVSLRHRQGDDQPWTVKLPSDVPGTRHEVSRPGAADRIPDDLRALVTVYHRGAQLAPVTVVHSVRIAYDLCDAEPAAGGRVLAELADDTVEVLDGDRVVRGFREIEVERKAGDTALLDRVGDLLTEAGARTGDFTPKHVRAIGPAARAAPDLPAPQPLPGKPSAADVVTAALRADVARILAHDPLVRLRAPVVKAGGGRDTAVHQMRVGTRRLRSDLRTFRPLLDAGWVNDLRAQLAWLAGALGAARDAEVLRTHLRGLADRDPLAPLDPDAVDRIDAQLAAWQDAALATLDDVLAGERYQALLTALLDAAARPRLRPKASARAGRALPKLVTRPWRKLARGGPDAVPAGKLGRSATDAEWHAVRIRAKKARYAADAVAAALGGRAAKLAGALADVQDVLGDHQDAAVAAGVWLDIARAHPDDTALVLTAGRLAERDRALVHTLRKRFPRVWRAAARGKLTSWLD